MIGGVHEICFAPRKNLPAHADIERLERKVGVELLYKHAIPIVIGEVSTQLDATEQPEWSAEGGDPVDLREQLVAAIVPGGRGRGEIQDLIGFRGRAYTNPLR